MYLPGLRVAGTVSGGRAVGRRIRSVVLVPAGLAGISPWHPVFNVDGHVCRHAGAPVAAR